MILGLAWVVIGFLFGFTANNAAAMIGCFVLGYLYMHQPK